MRETSISPRFYETDALGHINNVSIVGWFEAARTDILAQLLPADVRAQVRWLLANVTIDYLAELYYGREVLVRLEHIAVGNTSLTIKVVMSQNGKDCVRGSAVMVYLDAQSREKGRVPDAIREAVAGL